MMTGNDKARFGDLVGSLAVAMRMEASTPFLRAYWLALEDLTIDELETAVKRARRECEFMPTVAQLRKLAGKRPPGQEPPPYYRDADKVLDDTYSCDLHKIHGANASVSKSTSWCRPCQRQQRALRGSSDTPATLGDVVSSFTKGEKLGGGGDATDMAKSCAQNAQEADQKLAEARKKLARITTPGKEQGEAKLECRRHLAERDHWREYEAYYRAQALEAAKVPPAPERPAERKPERQAAPPVAIEQDPFDTNEPEPDALPF